MRAAHDLAGAPLEKIPLVLALEWHDAGRPLDATTDGLAQFQALMNRL